MIKYYRILKANRIIDISINKVTHHFLKVLYIENRLYSIMKRRFIAINKGGFMSKVVQFFSEFYNMQISDILKLANNIKDDELYKINNHMIKSILPDFDLSKSNINKYQEVLNKIDEENYKNNIDFITFADEKYPQILKNIKNFPKVLYYKGNAELLNYKRKIGVVGSRKPTPYGKFVTTSLVKDLTQNDFCIVSGFANGIDSISHKSAIENGGKTICVFGTPINKIYPASNKKLFEEVLLSNSLIISEQHCLKSSLPAFFALRNRIISGLSTGLLVTEAGAKSGTLITANYAMEQGKYIFSVPGNINSSNSIGTNSLIKDGACMTTSISDILFEYGYEQNLQIADETYDDLSPLENSIYTQVKNAGSCHAEKISISLSLNIQDVISILNILDIKGYISYDGFMANYKIR